MNFKYSNPEGTDTCALVLSHLWADVYGIDQRGSGRCSPDEWAKLIKQALEAASEKAVKSVVFRVIENSEAQGLIRLLPSLGFVLKEGRVEYRAFLADLPNDEGTPFEWKSAADLDWTHQQIAAFLSEVAQGALDLEPVDDPLAHIQDWLKDPVLTAGLECVSIGFMNGKASALVVAQINPRTLWSRLSYVGLIPERRGQRFGQWLHRHGFEMLKAQGGDLYHGGTNSLNKPMIRLFEQHGCRSYHRMQEWVWKSVEVR